ncbi:conserved hypothetical protein [Ricinus communis]|uniref:Uncharacterized protein n=1 Tax=Ricinus communis TaxID=3988 RepID=B9SQZ2_RICCO|nr:conserved hypothetical protein [Ricinus communis]
MIIIAWNGQGLRQSLTIRALRELTKKRFGFDNGVYGDPVGNLGGLALSWKREIQVTMEIIIRILFML